MAKHGRRDRLDGNVMKPLCVDLYAGLGGWAQGFLAEGWDVVGFDIECHVYGDHCYPGQLVLQDVLTLHGSQFRDASVIVASPPCQVYSYRAMPWKLASVEVPSPLPSWWRKTEAGMDWAERRMWAAWRREHPLPPPDNSLFEACFRIQREASEAGRYIPLVVENVRGAQPWVGSAKWHYGSYYLWGDIPALMPSTALLKGAWDNSARGKLRRIDGVKVPGLNWSGSDKPGYKAEAFNTTAEKRLRESDAEQKAAGTISPGRMHGKNSNARKKASAMIAKIPFPLAQHIARVFKP